MMQFRLLRQARQMTEYSCGTSTLQSMPGLWGGDIDKDALTGLTGTRAENGSFVRIAHSLDFTRREHLKASKANNRGPQDSVS
jgi:hypothetical protein